MSEKFPEGWRESSIGECCEILDSQRIPLNSEDRATRKGQYPYYGANGVQGYIDDFIFDGDAILLAEDGGNFDQYAERPIAQWVTGKYWVNNHAHILRAKEDILDRWVFYSLVHKNILKFINGGTRAKLNQSDLRDIKLLYPPLPEQKKIASILTSVDEVIENTQKQIDKLQDLKKATMNELLTKGIGHTEFKESELGRIPISWVVRQLDEVAKIVDCKHRTPTYRDKGYPVVRPRDVKFSGINFEQCVLVDEADFEDLNENHKPSVGDTIYSRNATFGIGAFVEYPLDFSIGQDVCIISPQNIDPKFLHLFLNSEIVFSQVLNEMSGSTFKRINLGAIKKFKIVVPEYEEQEKLASIISDTINLIHLIENKRSKLVSLKKSLMQDLLTGKVRVQVN